jgi:aminoglycoside 6'-N-acetyltransferase I
MQIVDLRSGNEALIQQAADLLVEGFKDDWPEAWPDMEAALHEVRESLAEERISRVALDADSRVLGWVGGVPHYDGNVWELHPLVVHSDYRGQGVGRALVVDLERQVRARGQWH